MTRTNTILSLVLAMIAAAATAADGYRSVDSIVAGAGSQPGTPSADVSSAKQLFAGSTRNGSSSQVSRAVHPASSYLDRYKPLALKSARQASQQSSAAPSGGQGYVDALLRNPPPPQASPVRVVEVRSGDGFHWFDALIGALIASGLLLVMLAAARSVARHRRITAESRA